MIRNVHESHAQENDQTDLDAQFEIKIPEHHCREDRKEEISGRVERCKSISLGFVHLTNRLKERTVGVIGELDDRSSIAASSVYSCLQIPQRSHIATDAQW